MFDEVFKGFCSQLTAQFARSLQLMIPGPTFSDQY